MYGDVVQLAENLWMIVGDLHADVPNALVYREGERLYLMDSGAGPIVRASLVKMLHDIWPV